MEENNKGYNMDEIIYKESMKFAKKLQYGLQEGFLGVHKETNEVASIDINKSPKMFNLTEQELKEVQMFISIINEESDSVLNVEE